MISVSSGWRAGRIRNGERLLRALVEVGAEAVELEYRTSERMLRQMRPMLQTGAPVVTSVHNFFPIPRVLPPRPPGGDVFDFASSDERERRRAVTFGIRSMTEARDLGAKAIVFHLNRLPMPDGMRELKAFYDRGELGSAAERRFKAGIVSERARLAPTVFPKVLRSVEELAEAARDLGVLIGVENRYNPPEIPSFEEIGEILERFPDAPLGYWHDVGHAFVQELFGFTSQAALLEAYSERMVGTHIHDVVGYDDHWAPGMGEVDFKAIAPFVPSAALRVIEVHSKVSALELQAAMRLLPEAGF